MTVIDFLLAPSRAQAAVQVRAGYTDIERERAGLGVTITAWLTTGALLLFGFALPAFAQSAWRSCKPAVWETESSGGS